MEQRRQRDSGTHHLSRRIISDGFHIVQALDTEELATAFESVGERLERQHTVAGIRDLVFRVFLKIDEKLYTHSYDLGIFVEVFLSDEVFKRDLLKIIRKRKDSDKRVLEVEDMFKPEMRAEIKFGAEIHDFGKIVDEIIRLTHKKGKPSTEERTRLEQHPAVAIMLQIIGVISKVGRAIPLYHHAPNYFGTDPYDEINQIFPVGMDPSEFSSEFPLYLTLVKLFDIFHAFLDNRPYKERGGVLWWEESKEKLPDDHHLKNRGLLKEK